MTRAIVLVLLLCGCATQPMIWDKQGWNQREASADEGQCKAQALSIPGALTYATVQTAAVFASCMQGKGYYQRPAY